MKKFDIKDVFSWSNAEDAKQYIGKQGYFADNLNDLQECVSNNNFKTLFSLDLDPETDVDSIFSITESDYYYALFLPADKVKEVEEKKWRAFTLEEFCNRFSIGTKISFRRKDKTRSIYGLFEGCQTDIDETETLQIIIICNLWYTLNDLFETYEYLDEHGEWQTFGVLDES